ncbi:hypothetical protein HPB52_010027 [Rhipicephalus sanguineus]|uniref:Uncharacterized protein n=1 Tax=Rhipicephalus sanguineus TaxID=34632 RepID=A0A9D4SU81_RHISA|nr:hypothetical protein HPB52_010027 [Rhipicephalus sanguineus]
MVIQDEVAKGRKIPQVPTIRILGLYLQQDGKHTETIKRLKSTLAATTQLIRRVTSKDHGLPEADALRVVYAYAMTPRLRHALRDAPARQGEPPASNSSFIVSGNQRPSTVASQSVTRSTANGGQGQEWRRASFTAKNTLWRSSSLFQDNTLGLMCSDVVLPYVSDAEITPPRCMFVMAAGPGKTRTTQQQGAGLFTEVFVD